VDHNEPLYNIGVVERMANIPAATLRIWERRYDFPEPTRTDGGHRLYSEREVQRLRWIKDKIDGGMQIRQAVRALKMQEAESADDVEAVSAMTSVAPLPAVAEVGITAPLKVFQQRVLASLLTHNTEQTEQVLNEALAIYSPEHLILDIIGPTLNEIGLGWQRGDVDIATEHLATNYLRQRLLMWMRTGPPPYAVQPTILACAPEELHDGSLLIFGALLRRRRWPVTYLGQSLPLENLAKLVQEMQPLAVVLVAMMEGPAQSLTAWPTWFPEAAQTGHPVVAYGGLIFNRQPEWRAKVPGLFLGATFREGVDNLERVLRGKITPEMFM
jgi:DNA-binding transcriptional MerR regulator